MSSKPMTDSEKTQEILRLNEIIEIQNSDISHKLEIIKNQHRKIERLKLEIRRLEVINDALIEKLMK